MLEVERVGVGTAILLVALVGVAFGVGDFATGIADVVGGVCLGWPGIGGKGTGVTLCGIAGTGTGVGVFDEDLSPGAGAGTGTGVSLGVTMSMSSKEAASFAGLGKLQCTQQQSL